MSAMTASGSKPLTSRQPHNIPLPLSPEKSTSHHNSKKRKTGKEKKEESNAPPQHPVGQDEWDHSRAGTQTWQWASLTDSSVGKHPPIFTKDGRYAFLFGRVTFCYTAEMSYLGWFVAISLPLLGHPSRYTLVPLAESSLPSQAGQKALSLLVMQALPMSLLRQF
jgi:hypothetical protein